MPLSAGNGRISDYAREYVETGILACSEPISNEDAQAAICQALGDDVTPGFIDGGERRYVLGRIEGAAAALEAAPLLQDPPVVRRIEDLGDAADQWCLLDACEEERRRAADEFLRIAQAPGLLYLLPARHLDRIRKIAERVAEGPTAEAKAVGTAVASTIEDALRRRTHDAARGPYEPAFEEGSAYYFGPQFLFRPPKGLTRPLTYWQRMWTSPPDVNIGVCEMSKRAIAAVDARLFNPPPASARARRSAIWEALNVAMRSRQCAGPSDAYIVRPGKGRDLAVALERFLPWQPYLEEAFVREGLPPSMAALSIPESGMRFGKRSSDGAAGPYQIMPGNVNIPAFDIQADVAVGIDERENPYLAAKAAALMLSAVKRRIQQPRAGGKGPDGYVEGVTFDDSLATLMAISGYHAGGGTLGAAMRQARDEFKRAGRKPTGEALFVHILTSERGYGTFQRDSKDYPVKFMPVIEALYGGMGPLGEAAMPEPMQELSLMEIDSFAGPTGLRDILRITNMNAEELLELNSQFDWERTAEEICLDPRTVDRVRILLPSVLALRLRAGLVAEGRVNPEKIRAERIITPDVFSRAAVAALSANRYVARIGAAPQFHSAR